MNRGTAGLILYGPPASGKTTIGQQVAEKTGFRLLVNHASVPLADAVFPRMGAEHGPEYFALLKSVRLEAVKAAVAARVSIIMTLAYQGSTDDTFVAALVDVLRADRGRVYLVQLDAPDDVLAARVRDDSRRRWGKLSDPDRLRTVLATRDVRASMPYREILRLDTSAFSAARAADVITRWIARYPGIRSHSGDNRYA